MKMPKFKSYKGGNLKGRWMVTRKLDGVCVLLDSPNRSAMSKRGKPLYGFDRIFDKNPQVQGMFEVFRTNWETTVSLVRTQDGVDQVSPRDLYPICPPCAELILHVERLNLTELEIQIYLWQALQRGEEGLVLYGLDGQGIYKVKPEITVDIRVIGIQPGTGKYDQMMGALLTNYGKVGTGFTDAMREDLNGDHMLDQIIEVGFMGWTPAGKMRHPRFKRVRWDKNEENLEGFKGDKEE